MATINYKKELTSEELTELIIDRIAPYVCEQYFDEVLEAILEIQTNGFMQGFISRDEMVKKERDLMEKLNIKNQQSAFVFNEHREINDDCEVAEEALGIAITELLKYKKRETSDSLYERFTNEAKENLG